MPRQQAQFEGNLTRLNGLFWQNGGAFSPIVERMSSRTAFFAHTPWDLVPTLMGLGHLVFVATLFFAFHAMPWALWIPLALLYSISIS